MTDAKKSYQRNIMKPDYESPCGRVKLWCKDMLEVASFTSADLTLTDPPYGIGENAKRVASRTKLVATIDYGEFDWDSRPASDEEISSCRAVSPKCIIWGGNYFNVPPSRGWLVWDKLNSGDFADAELAWTNLETSVRVFRHLWNGMIRGSERDQKRVHPTQKPIALMSWCIDRAVMEPGQTVADFWMGSCSSGIAALRAGLNFRGCDNHPRHFETAVLRIEKELAQPYLPILNEPAPVQGEILLTQVRREGTYARDSRGPG